MSLSKTNSPIANLRKRPIELGPADGNTQCVAKGLEPDETVVIGGANKVNPLMLVDENGVCAANPQMPALPVKPVFDQKALELEEAAAAPAAPQGAPAAPAKADGKDAKRAAKPNGGADK